MAQPRYEIQIMNPGTWEPIDYFEDAIEVTWSRKSNAVGESKITIPFSLQVSSYPRDCRILIWREKDGYRTLAGQTIWVLREITYDLSKDSMQLVAKDANSLIENRVVAYTNRNIFADKTFEEFGWEYGGPTPPPPVSDDMIKEYVSENMGPDATNTDRDLTAFGFLSIESKQGLGAVVEKTASFQNLLPTIQDIANQSKEAGTPLFFDMVPDVISGNFTFRTWVNFRGRDRSSTSPNPLVFSIEEGNLDNAQLKYDWSAEYNVLYYVGLGSEGGQIVEEYENPASLRNDPFGRREFVIQDSDKSNEDGIMDQLSTGFLQGATATVSLTGKAIDTDKSRYGIDFEFGDLVTGQAKGLKFDCYLEAVAATFRNGEEDIDIKLQSTIPVLEL